MKRNECEWSRITNMVFNPLELITWIVIQLEILSQQRALSLVNYSRSHDIRQWNCFPPKSGNIAKSEGNSSPLPANFDRRPPLQRSLMNFQLQNFQLYNKSGWCLRKQLIFLNLNVSLSGFSGNNINCFSRDQSLSVYYASGVPTSTELHDNDKRKRF